MDETWSYELTGHPTIRGRFVISVHCYRHPGWSTTEELEFDTFKDAVDYLSGQLND